MFIKGHVYKSMKKTKSEAINYKDYEKFQMYAVFQIQVFENLIDTQ